MHHTPAYRMIRYYYSLIRRPDEHAFRCEQCGEDIHIGERWAMVVDRNGTSDDDPEPCAVHIGCAAHLYTFGGYDICSPSFPDIPTNETPPPMC